MKSIKERFRNIRRIGLERDLFQDIYHQILRMNWAQFVGLYIVFFLMFNLLFGLLYWMDVNGVSGTDGNFFKNFSFSVQTFSTIGYGVFAPQSEFSHFLMVLESMLAIMFSALLTGLTFAKFSRPTARILFSQFIVITKYNGARTLMFRMANLRGNQIAEASVKASVLKTEVSAEGHQMRAQKELKFVRSTSSFFVLSWLVMHTIDQDSPFFGLNDQDILREDMEMSVSVIGLDDTLSQTVHSSCIYGPEDFKFDQEFEDIFIATATKDLLIDFTKFNLLKKK